MLNLRREDHVDALETGSYGSAPAATATAAAAPIVQYAALSSGTAAVAFMAAIVLFFWPVTVGYHFVNTEKLTKEDRAIITK